MHAGDPTLLFVPTEVEARRLRDQGGLPRGLALPAVCGFGPVASAARTAELCARLRPARALLVGIAGAYDTDAHPVGSALEFTRVAIDGIGAGEGRGFLGPPALGFPQWPGSPGTRGAPVIDALALASDGEPALLVTTCAAAASAGEVEARLERHPGALAEDMEGFAVAFACALAGVPLRIVRGISNRVGDRDRARWRVPLALAAARRRALAILADPSPWPEGSEPPSEPTLRSAVSAAPREPTLRSEASEPPRRPTPDPEASP